MNNTRTLLANEVVDAVSAAVEGVFDGLAPVAAKAEALFTGSTGARPRTGDLTALRPIVLDTLGGVDGLVVGAGFIAAPHVLDDQELGVEWWMRGSGDAGAPADSDTSVAPTRLRISLDPASDHFLDYTRQSWFTVPRDTGHRHITGPYVDYLCTDEYTLTFSVPVMPGGRFAGIVGSDVVVREFERVLARRLRDLPGKAALVNTQGRVIVSNNPRRAAGSLVRGLDIPAWWGSGAEETSTADTTVRRCGRTPIALLLESPAQST